MEPPSKWRAPGTEHNRETQPCKASLNLPWVLMLPCTQDTNVETTRSYFKKHMSLAASSSKVNLVGSPSPSHTRKSLVNEHTSCADTNLYGRGFVYQACSIHQQNHMLVHTSFLEVIKHPNQWVHSRPSSRPSWPDGWHRGTCESSRSVREGA